MSSDKALTSTVSVASDFESTLVVIMKNKKTKKKKKGNVPNYKLDINVKTHRATQKYFL